MFVAALLPAGIGIGAVPSSNGGSLLQMPTIHEPSMAMQLLPCPKAPHGAIGADLSVWSKSTQYCSALRPAGELNAAFDRSELRKSPPACQR